MSDFYSNIFCYGLNVDENNSTHRFSVIQLVVLLFESSLFRRVSE